jgi:hypothetical protein
MRNIIKGQVIGALGGEQAGSAYWDQFKPTNEIKNNQWMGITAPQARQFEIAKRLKEGTMSLQPGQTNILPNRQKIVAPNFETGVAGGFDAYGNPVSMEIPGSAAIAANRAGAVAGATKAAELPYGTPTTVDTQDGPHLMTPAQQIAAANGDSTSTPINNPGNIRPVGSSTGFQQFKTPEEGFAAIDKNLQAYGAKGINTVSSIINRWAPPSDNNDTKAYIQDVSSRLGVKPDQPLDMGNPVVRQALSTAITLHEQGPAKVFGAPQKSSTPGLPLKSPEQKKGDEEKGAAAINAAKVEEASAPLFAAINDARRLVEKLPYGSLAPVQEWIANQPVIGDPEKSAAIARWNNLMGNFTMNGIASSGLGRMDIPIVNAINKASNVPIDASPAAKMAALDQIEANLKRHVASLKNVVPNLNQPGVTQNTQSAPMAAVSSKMPSFSEIEAEIARRRVMKGQ